MSGELKKLISNKTAVYIALGLVLLGIWGRFVPHPPNMAPIAAIAIFGGAMLPKKYSMAVPLAAIIATDLFLGFHSTIFWTWGSFALIAVLSSKQLRDKLSMTRGIAVTLGSSIMFYVLTNFGVWLQGGLYEPTVAGLTRSYINGLPFFRNTLAGDLIYTGAIFGAFYLCLYASKRLTRKGLAQQKV